MPAFNTNWSIDLRKLDADTGRFLFLINWEPRPVRVDVCVPRASHVGEMTTRAAISLMNGTRIVTEVPAQGGSGMSRRLSDPARTALIVLDISAPPLDRVTLPVTRC